MSGDDAEEQDRFLRMIGEDAPAMLWASDETGACVYLNRTLRAFWNAPDDLDGFDWSATLHPDDHERVLATVAAAVAGRSGMKVEGRHRRHDGEYRLLETEAHPRFDAEGRFRGLIGVNRDVTDARRTEAALKESEGELIAMVENAAAGIFKTTLDGRVLKINDRFCEMLGRTREEIVGLNVVDLTHPEDVAATRAARNEALKRPAGTTLEKRYVRKDGDTFWALAAVRLGRDSDDGEPWLMVISIDISDAKAAGAAVRESEARFRLLANTAPAPVWMSDATGAVEFVNETLVDFFGWPAEQSLGRVWEKALHREDREAVARLRLDARTAQQPFGFEARFRNAAGEWRWMRVATKPRLDADGRFMGYVGMAFDVTDNRQAIERLRESEERFRDIADTAPVLIWVTRPDRVRSFVNRAYVDFLGFDYETVRTADWRAYLHPDDHERVLRESMAGEASGQPFSMEARYRRHDGEWRWLRSFSRPRLDDSGQVTGFVGVAFDVNEAKQVEQDLTRINELLAERVSEAMEEKAQVEADLMHAQRMEAVGRLTGGVAHDFNNLLTVVIGALDMILKSPDDAARRQKMGEAALNAARRGERLTHQLLAFSRRQALRPEPCDLNALIREGEPLLRRAAGDAVRFRLDLRRGGAWARVDAAQFEAALLNLVVNARDALNGEGGQLTVSTEACEVAVGQAPELTPGDYICLVVTDSGPGIDPAILDRVFEPFFTTKAVGRGTGLGLSQVYGFARQSGGGVQITSQPGKGTEVRLYLPPLPGAIDAPERAAEPETPDRALAGRRILLVEDDASVAVVAVALLESFGLEVESAESAGQALMMLEEGDFDLMLSDIVMPGGMSGVALAHEAARRWPGMRIILTTGYAGEDGDESLGGAPWPLLTKPYSTEALLLRLSEALSVG